MPTTSPSQVPPSNIAVKKNSSKTSFIALLVAVLLVILIVGTLQARVAGSGTVEPRAPLVVQAVEFNVQTEYQRPMAFLGLIKAGRRTALSFEEAGRIVSISASEGSVVEAGQTIASLDQAALKSARKQALASFDQAKVELELAELKARRQKKLQATGAVSKDVFDETRLRAKALAARLAASRAGLAAIDIKLSKSHIVAPFAGVIADRFEDTGTVVRAGTPILSLVELTQQEAHIGVSVTRATALVSGKSYELKMHDKTMMAVFKAVRPDVNPLTRSVTAVFSLSSSAEGVAVLDGEPVTLALYESISMKGGWLPITALQEGERGVWIAFGLQPAPEQGLGLYRTTKQAIEVLDVQGDRAFVRGTMAHGTKLVANGPHRVSTGILVKLNEVN